MNGRFLLDTNIIIALFAQDISVQKHLAEAQEVFVPILTLGELYYGAQKSAHIEANLLRINKFAEGNVVLFCDIETAQQYGHIKNSLRKKGQPIPENDIWIAAIAKQHLLTLVSRDEHFKEIEELSVQTW